MIILQNALFDEVYGNNVAYPLPQLPSIIPLKDEVESAVAPLYSRGFPSPHG